MVVDGCVRRGSVRFGGIEFSLTLFFRLEKKEKKILIAEVARLLDSILC